MESHWNHAYVAHKTKISEKDGIRSILRVEKLDRFTPKTNSLTYNNNHSFGPIRPISSLEAEHVTYPRVVFDWSPSSGVTTRWWWAERGREERPPELLLHPNGLMCLWIWGRRQVWTRGRQGVRVKQHTHRRRAGGERNRRWDKEMQTWRTETEQSISTHRTEKRERENGQLLVSLTL